jgi:imidazolonepropionase-like amidohydrolase
MRIALALGALIVLATGLLPEPQPVLAQAATGPIAIVGGTLIDGATSAPRPNAMVLIRDGRIERVGTVGQTPVPNGYTVVRAEGSTVLPGLTDMHVHLLYAGHTGLQYWHQTYTDRYEREIMPATTRQLLMAGVTSVRDMGAPPDAVFGIKRRIDAGEIDGPTVYAAGPQLTHQPPDWAQRYRWGVSGVADATTKATELLGRGAGLLKVTDAESMTVEEIRAIVEAAHGRGKLVSAHGRTDAEIRIGLAAGVDDFQHIGVAGGGTPYPDDLIAAVRARAAAGRPFYWTPTIGVPLGAETLRSDPGWRERPANYAGLPSLIAQDVREAILKFSPQAAPREAIVAKTRQLREAGVQLLLGTDGGLAGAFHADSTWREMDAWVRDLGISPMDTIQRATSGAARALGVDRDYGTIEPGKRADVIVVDGNPLQSMGVLREPTVVIKHGRRVK